MFDEGIKETEDKIGRELPEGTKDALHSTSEKYMVEHGLVSPQDESINDKDNANVEDDDNDDN